VTIHKGGFEDAASKKVSKKFDFCITQMDLALAHPQPQVTGYNLFKDAIK